MFQIAVLVSGGGTNLQALIDQIRAGRLKGVRIKAVLASKEGCLAQKRAEAAGIETFVVSRKKYQSLQEFDQALLAVLRDRPVDLVVLAGFLCLLGPDFIAAYPNRIINVHPSLIPAFCGPGFYGIKPHEAALQYGVRISGATVHLVDSSYDTGPIVLQKAVEIVQGDTAQSLQKRIMLDAEQQILPQAIALFAAGRITVCGRKVLIKEEKKSEKGIT